MPSVTKYHLSALPSPSAQQKGVDSLAVRPTLFFKLILMEKSLKILIYIAIALLILFLIEAIALDFLMWKNVNDSHRIINSIHLPEPVSTPTVEPQPTPTPTPSSTVTNNPNLKTYTSSNFGFSIQYPSDWKLDLTDNMTGDILDLTSPATQKAFDDNRSPIGFDLNVEYFKNVSDYSADYKTLDDLVNKGDANYTGVTKISQTTLSGLKAYKVLVTGEGAIPAIMVEHNGLYVLALSDDAKTQALILENFHFSK